MYVRVGAIKMYSKQCEIHSWLLTPLWQWGLNLDLNGIGSVIINISVSENYGFDTIISDYYWYHRYQNSYQLFRKPRFDTNIGLLLFLRFPFSNPRLRVYLNGIGTITIHLNAPKIYEFHTNVGRYYFTCISTPSQRWYGWHLNVIRSVFICLKDQASHKT